MLAGGRVWQVDPYSGGQNWPSFCQAWICGQDLFDLIFAGVMLEADGIERVIVLGAVDHVPSW